MARRRTMKHGHRQVIAEKVGSTVRALELLGLDYEVSAPRRQKEEGNKSPRVVYVKLDDAQELAVYNSADGYTWVGSDGKRIPTVKSVEDLYDYLRSRKVGR